MTDRDDFLAWVKTALYEAELALHNGDAAPRRVLSDFAGALAWLLPACGKLGIRLVHSTPHRPVVLGAGERIFHAPLTIEPASTTVFSGGAVAHVLAAHP